MVLIAALSIALMWAVVLVVAQAERIAKLEEYLRAAEHELEWRRRAFSTSPPAPPAR